MGAQTSTRLFRRARAAEESARRSQSGDIRIRTSLRRSRPTARRPCAISWTPRPISRPPHGDSPSRR
eukprot:14541266-Alexandrium_andersonii.AAC.1